MKRRHIFLSFLLILVLVVPVQAQTQRVNTERVTLSFSGTTANCRVQIVANSNESISATIRLWNGNECIQTWQRSATTSLSFYETATVQKGQSYTLTVDYTIAGKSKPTLSTSGTC